MFGALNRFIARLDGEPGPRQNDTAPSDDSYGFQVLRNTNKELPLEPWFDFIIGINGHFIDSPDPDLFTTELRNCAGGYCSLDLWNAKGQKSHSLTITVPAPPESLGLSLQLAPLNSTQNIWHVLTVPSPLSPAHQAGLLPHSDYILGSPSGTLKGEAALGELVEDHLNRSLVLWVYNSEFDVVREVELVPRRGWGGEGAVGAVLGFGALHRLPVGLGEEIQAPGESLFDADKKTAEDGQAGDNVNAFSPAPIQDLPPPPMVNPNVPPPPMMNPNAPPPSGPAPSKARKGRHHAGPSPRVGFEDMFAEGAKKSAEADNAPSRKGTPLAPPPKIASTEVTPHSVTREKSDPLEQAGEDLGEPGEALET
ncbi:GRASP55/65 PDZ-like domain-containing protein [Exophiala viscosa]|uniref:GRASP55/65 PDZ-like domain-containing protein n=1 Tax=Exophiala viscosa TaxID=2486360 RepID=UPI002199705D|nr:GRASP55/65 PDZ-like domain-containing protein [Exophiala viscosa]